MKIDSNYQKKINKNKSKTREAHIEFEKNSRKKEKK
jgi:hypothetical protein